MEKSTLDSLSFGKKLSVLRTIKGEDQKTVGEAVGLCGAMISHYEKGKRVPGLANAVKLAKYFDVSIEWLFGDVIWGDKNG